jgi:hypothetical protein
MSDAAFHKSSIIDRMIGLNGGDYMQLSSGILQLDSPLCIKLHSLEPADKEFPFIHHLRRKMVMDSNEELFVTDNFMLP